MSHIPKPWIVSYLVASGGFEHREDAERAVACVNACRNIPTAMLTGVVLVPATCAGTQTYVLVKESHEAP